jgi:benzoylformate decarboxylase
VVPGGFLSVPNGALGFALSGAIGVRMGLTGRGVVAILGDGAAMFGIQGLWSAAEYGAGVVLIVLANGSYGVMDEQAAALDGRAPWPQFGGIDIAGIARALGCPATRIETHEQLLRTFDEELTRLDERAQPILIEVVVSP